MNKKLAIGLGFVIGLPAIGMLVLYLIFHFYYTKMNYEERGAYVADASLSENDVLDMEDVDFSIADSDADEIADLEKMIDENINDDSLEFAKDKDVFNVLLIGCDARSEGGRGRSDSMILVSINSRTKQLVATSIMRDTYCHIPGHQDNRINAAYAFGGADLLIETIEQNFKISIDRYVAVDFFVFVDVIDAVGGVDIDVQDWEVATLNGIMNEINMLEGLPLSDGKITSGGMQHLNGRQALSYARIRHVGNADFERTERQRRVLEQIFLKVKDCSFSELTDILSAVLPEVTTDMKESELLSLILNMPSYRNYELIQHRVPADGTYQNLRIRGMAVLGIDFKTNIDEMKRVIY